MGFIENERKKRANYAAEFTLYYLTGAQLVEIYPVIKELEGEALKSAHKDFAEKRSQLRITVTRIANTEVQWANRGAQPAKALWPLLLRHITKAEERSGDTWEPVELEALSEFLEDDRNGDLAERDYLINSYLLAAESDRRLAEADPNFSERAS